MLFCVVLKGHGVICTIALFCQQQGSTSHRMHRPKFFIFGEVLQPICTTLFVIYHLLEELEH